MSSNNEPEMLHSKLQYLRKDYLDLMESCLTGVVFRDASLAPVGTNTFDHRLREHGLDWPAQALTMIGSKRMANLRALTESVIAENVPGDLIETGVWRGGSCIMMRAILHAHGIADRCVWVADSFEGLPAPNELQYPADVGSDFHAYEQLSVSLEQVQKNFRSYGLLDEQVKFLKGWFKDTLPSAPVEQFALLRLDGDMYESTMDALVSLYPKLSSRGYAIIDDFHYVPACKAAVHDYWDAAGIRPEVFEIDGVGVYWRKSDTAGDAHVSIDSRQTATAPAAQIARLSESLITLNRNVIAMLGKSLAERDGTLETLKRTLAERNSAVETLSRTLAERLGEVEALNKSLAELYSSTSWRLTKPLRSIREVLNGKQASIPAVKKKAT